MNKPQRNAMSGFLFFTLLSQQVLFEVFFICSDFSTFLDKLYTGFRLSNGVRAPVGDSWPALAMQYRQQSGMDLPGSYISSGVTFGATLTARLGPLKELVENGHLSPSISSACVKAVDALRDISYMSELSTFLAFRFIRVLRWTVVVSLEFIKLLEKRQPEALLITACYSVLLSEARAYWVFA